MNTSQQPRAGQHLISVFGPISQDVVLLGVGPALRAGQLLAQGADHMYAPYDNASETLGKAIAVLYAPHPARTEPVKAAVTARLAEVMAGGLVGLDDPARADLAERFIIVR